MLLPPAPFVMNPAELRNLPLNRWTFYIAAPDARPMATRVMEEIRRVLVPGGYGVMCWVQAGRLGNHYYTWLRKRG
jgi:hypothetical protein